MEPMYWSRVFRRCEQMIKQRPEIKAEAVFRLARHDVDNEIRLEKPELICWVCGEHHSLGMACPKLKIT